jgi:Zn-dependent protease
MNAEVLALSVVILLFSVILHEVMHGLIALKFGDHTAENAGRLTLNPIPHIDPIGTILLPGMLLFLNFLTPGGGGFLIGWAKPVPVNPLNFKDIRAGELWVSLAGVGANFFLALSAAVLYHIAGSLGAGFLILEVLQFTVAINLMLGVFNLLPIPPLDGSKALMSFLPLKQAQEFEKITPYGFIIIIALLYFDILGLILNLVLTPLYAFLGIPRF